MTTDSPTPSAAPPTTQGERPLPRRADRVAVWSLVCGIVGMLLVPVAIAGIVLGIVALRRLAQREDGGTGRGVAIGGICTGGAGILLVFVYAVMGVWIFATAQTISSFEAVTRLQRVRGEARAYADLHGGYPDHVARLILDQDVGSRLHMTWADEEQPVVVRVGTYDLAAYDDTLEADRALLAAVEAVDRSTPFYRFGEFWFVRLPAPTHDPDIVFAWWNDERFPTVVMDAGEMYFLNPELWDDIWKRDADARQRRGMPAVAPPPNPYARGEDP